MILVIYRLAANVPVPGINSEVLRSMMSQLSETGSFLAFLDPAKGGLSAAGLKAALTAQVKLDAREPMERPGAARGLGVGWCLGWSVNATRGGDIFHHSGSNQTGFRCFSQFDPARGTGLVILTNGLSGGSLWVRLVSRVGDM
ncbi:MAG: serine hydrolase [Holophaga sp.]|nr:serine hydrolase [Holophaga sp.]